jgi:hypothetical protein
MAIGGEVKLQQLYNKLFEKLNEYDNFKIMQQQQQQHQQIAGNIKVYTGPKKGKFIINKHGKKVYIDRKTLNNSVPYNKKANK